jgi:hypothetical protein
MSAKSGNRNEIRNLFPRFANPHDSLSEAKFSLSEVTCGFGFRNRAYVSTEMTETWPLRDRLGDELAGIE